MGRMWAARGSMCARNMREKLFWVLGWLPKRQSAGRKARAREESAPLAKAAAAEPALAFVKFLASDAARQAWMSAGFEMLPAR